MRTFLVAHWASKGDLVARTVRRCLEGVGSGRAGMVTIDNQVAFGLLQLSIGLAVAG